MVSPPGIMNPMVGKWYQTLPNTPREVACPMTQHSLDCAAGEQVTPGSPELPQVASSHGAGEGGPGGRRWRGSPAARSEQPRPRCPTFMSLMMVWKRPPSALHSFSITASIFPGGGDRTRSRDGCTAHGAGLAQPGSGFTLGATYLRLAAGFAESTRCSQFTALCPPSPNPRRPAALEGESATCSARLLASKMSGED